MKIGSSLVAHVAFDGPTRPGSTSGSSKAIGVDDTRDTVSFSDRDEIARSLQSQLSQLSDTRSERVHALKTSVQAGKYRVSADEVADAMCRELPGFQRIEVAEGDL